MSTNVNNFWSHFMNSLRSSLPPYFSMGMVAATLFAKVAGVSGFNSLSTTLHMAVVMPHLILKWKAS